MPEVILPCPNPQCWADNKTNPWAMGAEDYNYGSHHSYTVECCCGAAGPRCRSEADAIAAWNAFPRMSTIIAWQLQASGAALALQRLMDAAQAMREAQQAYEQYGSNEDSVTEAEAVFDGLLADYRNALEARNG